MRSGFKGSNAMTLAGLALMLASMAWAQSTPSATPASTPPADTPTAQPAPGTTPVGGDTPAAKQPSPDVKQPKSPDKQPAPGTAPVGGYTPAPTTAVNPEKVVEPGSQKINVKQGGIDDVSSVGNRDIGGRGMGNWDSTDTEIKMGKGYSMEIEKSTKFITDPTVTE